jgi:hypothetical protein
MICPDVDRRQSVFAVAADLSYRLFHVRPAAAVEKKRLLRKISFHQTV